MAIENHDDYIAAQPEWARPLLSRLRGQIATLVPEADECISYNMPAFRLPDGKVVAGYAGFKKHCAYLPHSGGVLAACADALQGYANTQGSLHFTADKPLSDALVRTLIDARKAEIAAVAVAKAARKEEGMSFEATESPFAAERELRELGLSWPETVEESPWGERVLKVNGKIFCFLGTSEQQDGSHRFHFTAKLPESAALATAQPWASPTGYNLGKSGWVSARFDRPADVPVALLRDWLDESYRAVAPKRAVKKRDAG